MVIENKINNWDNLIKKGWIGPNLIILLIIDLQSCLGPLQWKGEFHNMNRADLFFCIEGFR